MNRYDPDAAVIPLWLAVALAGVIRAAALLARWAVGL